jgi:leader peptidase (prepilin peptidase)/N-methyltransferase
MWTSEVSPWFLRVCALAFGAVWGSFFNVAIYRWPRDMSIVAPPSQCFSCGKRIRWYHNVPIVGYVALGGKSACCRERIPPRYVMVEVIAAAMALALVEKFAVTRPDTMLVHSLLETCVYFFFVGGLVVATFVDLEWMLIPDEVSLVGAAFGLVTAPMRSEPGLSEVVLGAGGAFLVIQLFFVWGYERALGRRGMGEGDAKLLMMIGAFIGWRGAAFSVIAGSLQGLVVAVVFLLLGKSLLPENVRRLHDQGQPPPEQDTDARTAADTRAAADVQPGEPLASEPEEGPQERLRMPFGPFLALGAMEFLLFGEAIVGWYSSLLQD